MEQAHQPPVTLLRTPGVLGEVVLRRRVEAGSTMVELLVGGVLLMDDQDASTERLLATTALAGVRAARARVLVGGLGLGFTAAAALADPRVQSLVVVEIEPALVQAAAAGLVPGGPQLLADPRVSVVVGDVRAVLTAQPAASLDAVLLDVDNGPGFLVHDRNAGLYTPAALDAAAATLAPGGVLAVWSSERSPALDHALTAVLGGCDEHVVQVSRSGRDLQYALYLAQALR